ETRIAIALPLATTAPAAGFWLITAPAGTVALEAVVTAPTRSPAPVIAVDAALCVRPTTFGTVTGGGPDETTIANALPTTTWVPAIGFWLITEPVGTVELGAVVMEPTVRPALAIAVDAAACVRPTTFGAATFGGPDETTSATALLIATCVPAVGFWL